MSMTERAGIEMVCEGGHRQRLFTPDFDYRYALEYCAILDGTSAFYKYPPREYPMAGSVIGKCHECGAWFRATPFGFPEQS